VLTWRADVAGDLLFVPAGCPHAVANLSASAAVSMNFITASNQALAVDELSVAGLTDPAAAQLAAHLGRCGRHPYAARGEEADVPWARFKRPTRDPLSA